MARAPVALTALVSLLAACAPREAGLSGRSTELCWWRGTRWEDRAPLRLRGSDVVLGHARAGWEGGVWRGAKTSGALRRAGATVLFEGVWHGAGLTVHADVDASAEAVFRSWEPKRLEAGVVLRGTPLRLLDAKVGEVLATPSRAALAAFVPSTPAVFSTSCEGLTLISPTSTDDEPRRLLARAGFDTNAQEVRVRAAAAPLDGAWTGQVSEARAFIVGRDAGAVRLALPSEGMVWVTWTAEGDVTPAPERTSAAEPPAAVPAPRGSHATVRRCDDELPLYVEARDQVVEIGRLDHAGFRVGRTRGELVVITPLATWLELAPGLELLAPVRAATCAEVGAGS